MLWLGPSISSGDRKFGVPDTYPLAAATCGVDETGQRYVRVKGVRWFTNLDHKKRHEELILYRSYTAESYPTYDNYDAIEVSRVKDIPVDWAGVMGVPITFLDKYNPDQFEVLGSDFEVGQGNLKRMLKPNWMGKADRAYVKGKRMYSRILIKWRKS